jgi:hypothetical protein
VRADAAARIREDTVASIRTYGLLGDRYVELSAGSAEVEALAPGGLVKAIDPTDIEAVIGQSGDIATNVVEVTASLKDVLGAIQRGEGLLGAMVRNRELGEATLEDLRATMAHVQGTTRSLEQILARVDRGEGLLGQLTTRTADNAALLQRIDRSVKSIEGFADELRSGRGALWRLVTDQAWADRVSATSIAPQRTWPRSPTRWTAARARSGRLVNDPALYDRSTAVVDRWAGAGSSACCDPSAGCTCRAAGRPDAGAPRRLARLSFRPRRVGCRPADDGEVPALWHAVPAACALGVGGGCDLPLRALPARVRDDAR